MRLAPQKLFFPHYTPEFAGLVRAEREKLPETRGEVMVLEDAGAAFVLG